MFRLIPLLVLSVFCISCASTPPIALKRLAAAGVDSRTYAKIQAGRVLDFGDILGLVKEKIPDATIVAYLKSTHAPYRLTNPQILQITDAGAGSDLVNYLGKSTGFFEATQRSQTGGKKWQDHPYFNDPYYWGAAPFDYAFPGEWDDPTAMGMVY